MRFPAPERSETAMPPAGFIPAFNGQKAPEEPGAHRIRIFSVPVHCDNRRL